MDRGRNNRLPGRSPLRTYVRISRIRLFGRWVTAERIDRPSHGLRLRKTTRAWQRRLTAENWRNSYLKQRKSIRTRSLGVAPEAPASSSARDTASISRAVPGMPAKASKLPFSAMSRAARMSAPQAARADRAGRDAPDRRGPRAGGG